MGLVGPAWLGKRAGGESRCGKGNWRLTQLVAAAVRLVVGDGPGSTTDFPDWMTSSTVSGKPTDYEINGVAEAEPSGPPDQELGTVSQDRF